MSTLKDIAKVCHETNKALCETQGDMSQPSWEDAPDWQRNSALKGVAFHLTNLDAGTADSHNSWLAEKAADGWIYGPVKDADKKEHPCFVPYEELPASQQVKDYLFRSIVHAFYDAGCVDPENERIQRQ